MSTIVNLLEEAQRRFGNNSAVVGRRGYRTQRWSYSHLWSLSENIAGWLQRKGINKGDRIVLVANNSPTWVAAYFGCLRAGAILVPLDVRSSPEFVQKVVELTHPSLVFLSSAAPKGLDCRAVPIVMLEELESLLDEASSTPERVPISPDDIAEVMFTSGTTGDPKGVVLTHGNIVANVHASIRMVPSVPSYRLLSLLPLSHMLEQTVGLLAPLTGGASIYYPQSRRPTVIFRAFKEQRITTLVLVPQALQLFINSIEARVKEKGRERMWHSLHRIAPRLPIRLRRVLFASVHRQLGGALKFIVCGGAYLDPALAQKWEGMGVPVLQGYGTTEAAPIVSCNTFQRRRLDSVGTPLPGVEVKTAGSGEIMIRGDNVTRGYWKDPEATSAAFEDGWYKTGDLGFLDEEGYLHLKGRTKDLIVLSSGLNVYPEDLEVLLRNHPAVADAAVIGLPKQKQDVQVHAALLLKDGVGDAKEIVDQVNLGLAPHQRIQEFTIWPEDDFPRTNTLKVKKHLVLDQLVQIRAGEQPEFEDHKAGPGGVAHLVSLLARMTRKPLEQIQSSTRLGADLGLDSLGRVELLAAVESELDVDVDETQLSEDATVGDLEDLIARGAETVQNSTYWDWPTSRPVSLARAAIQPLLLFPVMRLLASRKVKGREHLKELLGLVLFVANHLSLMDTPAVLAALPQRYRLHTAPAVAAQIWFARGRFQMLSAAFLVSAFPFSQSGSIRASVERCDRLLDKGWSILIFPEGTRSDTGRMGPFKSGAGLLAVELGVPVVPVHVKGTNKVLPKDGAYPRHGHIEVRFGEALHFLPRTSYGDVTKAIEGAVKKLEADASK